MIRYVIFDFDGTLVDSNRIKRDAFFHVVDDIPDGNKLMEAILSDPNVGDRYDIFSQFVETVGLEHDEEVKRVTAYGQHCERLISQAPEMAGATEVLQLLHQEGFGLYINSATPQRDLIPIVDKRGLSVLLKGTYGGPATKVENIQTVMSDTGASPHEIAVVGDGADDLESAQQTGCQFVPVFEARGYTDKTLSPLTNLVDLPARLQHLETQALSTM